VEKGGAMFAREGVVCGVSGELPDPLAIVQTKTHDTGGGWGCDMGGAVGKEATATSSVADAISVYMQSLSRGDTLLGLGDLVEFQVNSKTYFCCSQCGYFNTRKYHSQMHFQRIHVQRGRPMPKKRKFTSVLPDKLLSSDHNDAQKVYKIGGTTCTEGVYRAQVRVAAVCKKEKKMRKLLENAVLVHPDVLSMGPSTFPDFTAVGYCIDAQKQNLPGIASCENQVRVDVEERATLRRTGTPEGCGVPLSIVGEGVNTSVGPEQDVLHGATVATDTHGTYSKGRYTFRGRKETTTSLSESRDENLRLIATRVYRVTNVKRTKHRGVARRRTGKSPNVHKTAKNTTDSAPEHQGFAKNLHCLSYTGFATHLTFGGDSVHWDTRE